MSLDGGPRTGVEEPRSPSAAQAAVSSRLPWLLAVCCVSQFMVILDLTIVNVALPSIQASLGFSPVNLQWVIVAYAIVFAGFLMLGGRAADQLGQRRTLVLALVLFALASLAGGAAVDQAMLLSARAVQGLSGALMAASSLAAITSSFPPGPARHKAIGLWGAMNGAGGAAGALFGGVITQEWGWRWVLLINPPIGIAAAAVAYLVVKDRPTHRGAKFDLLGALVLTGGMMITAYGIVNASSYGWSTRNALVPIIVGVALSALFPLVEARAKAPLVPLAAFTKPLRRANLVVLLFSAALFPMWYVSSLYLQQVLGLSPLRAGLAFLPMALVIFATASQAGRLVGLFGVRATLSGGLALLTAGLLLFARIGPSGSPIGFVVLPGLLVAAGIGLSIVPSTIAATQIAGREQAGLASGLVNTSRQIGGSLGIALLISIATSYTSHLIGMNSSVLEALTQGFRVAYFIGAGFSLAALVAALTLLPKLAGPPRAARAALRLPAIVAGVIALFALIDFTAAGAPGPPVGAYVTAHSYSWASAPGLHPPMIRADRPTDTAQLAPGYFLIGNFYDITKPPMRGQSGPLILDNQLRPVWFRPVPTAMVASNLSVATYQGQPALAWWQGQVTSTGATLSGEYVIVNDHYQTIATVKGANGWIPTIHSLVISGNDAFVTVNKNETMNLARYGGSVDGAITDSGVQEFDLRAGRLVWSWDARNHIPLTDSHANPPVNGFPWDVYHINSVSLAGQNRLLVSMRNTWAAYLVHTPSGAVAWTLGGKHSSFRFAPGASFQWQHDVTMRGGSGVTLFNDNCCQITGAGVYLAPNGPSEAMALKLNFASHEVTRIAAFTHGNVAAAYMGSAQFLPGGNVFVGWGQMPFFSEFSSSGRMLLDAAFPAPDMSYRAVQIPRWSGLPLTQPGGAARASGGRTIVYASWNGATGVHAWRVLAGSSPGQLRPVVTAARSGFQTAIGVPGGGERFFGVQALSPGGRVMGTSRVFRSAP